MTEQANTPAWQHRGEWRAQVAPYGRRARYAVEDARVAVAADRAHLATQIEAIREVMHDGTGWIWKDDVLAVLRDTP